MRRKSLLTTRTKQNSIEKCQEQLNETNETIKLVNQKTASLIPIKNEKAKTQFSFSSKKDCYFTLMIKRKMKI